MLLYSGTSGYSYKEWKGGFYPEKIAAGDMLRFYGERLPAVEINNTFYRMPKSAVMARWAGEVPDRFQFVIKGSRRITHFAKLQAPEETLGYLWGSIEKLGDRLGCVFFQLPKWMRKDVALLGDFLDCVGNHYRCAFEFQHRTWFDDDTYELLTRKNATIVINDSEGATAELPPTTSDWGYVRMRRNEYEESDLQGWAASIRDQGWDEAYVFFKHEDGRGGPELATRFQTMFES